MTMPIASRTEIKIVKETIANINAKAANILSTIGPLYKTIEELVCKIIEEEKMLRESYWILRHNDSYIWLHSNPKRHKKLGDIAKDELHYRIDFVGCDKIRFTDEDIYIYFKDPKDIKKFVKTHRLKVKPNAIDYKIKEMKAKLKELKKLRRIV